MTVETVTIPAAQITKVAAKIAKLAKKAMKYGNDDITISFSDTYMSNYRDIDGNKYQMMMVDATIAGDAPIYDGGWKLLARLGIIGEANLVHEVPNSGHEINNRFRTHANICEHCMKDRRRNDLFVFEGENGDQVAVGRTCLHDFMGIDNPQMIVQRAAFFESLKQISDEEFTSFISTTYRIKEVLTLTAAEIRENGWVSKAVAGEQGISSTADMVKEVLIGNPKVKIAVENEDVVMAENVIEFFQSMEFTGNNYMDNLVVLMKESVFNKKLVGLVASAVAAYKRSISFQKEKEEKNSDFIGSVKERLRSVELTLVKEIFIGSSQFGDKFLYSFEDVSGNSIVWFTSKQNLEEGKNYNVDATVKEHKIYNGVNQTVITRAKIK